ncbi:unnamed protein product [Microthlaspi erraticum]|uniref:F-box domain-containing protein n=1 Tax=Microthlaspi erraticum TaxID=1685480 RepID=A0A6D2I6Q8_9BRAS|nr:unnamed protein product [Microthlaspi erraticum]
MLYQRGDRRLKLATIYEGRETEFIGWENLDTDVLVRIFQKCYDLPELSTSRLGHVCRKWRQAFRDPMLWKTIDLSGMKSTFIKIPVVPFVYVNSSSDEQLKRILDCCMRFSNQNTTTLIFHYNLYPTNEMITNIAQSCPNMRRLVLLSWTRIKEAIMCDALSHFKNLESLTIPSMTMPSMIEPENLFPSIKKNCKNLRELKVMGTIDLCFVKNLVKHLQQVKVLSLRCNSIHQDALLALFDGMKDLEVLNVCHCYIFVPEGTFPDWSKILEKASQLKRVMSCFNPQTCDMCRRACEDEGMVRWYKCEEGLWKADELASLHL